MGININSNYIPAININKGVSISGVLSVNTNSFYNVINYQTINIIKPEDLLEIKLNTPSQITSYSNDNLVYIVPYTFASTGITSASFLNCTIIGINAFRSCSSLITANFPNCTAINNHTFYYCRSLTTTNFPNCTSIGDYAFYGCRSLTAISFPACISINNTTFGYCSLLTLANFPVCTTIGSYAFRNCYNLLSLYLMGSSLCSLLSVNAFSSTPISNYTTSTGGVYGSIYVPSSLLTTYQSAKN